VAVDNLLKVRAKKQPTDAQMETQLKAALAWDPLVDSNTIAVAVTNRVVHLSGTVDSSLDKAEAQDVASRIKGVLSVHNNLKIEREYSIDYHYYDYSPYSSFDDWPNYNHGFYYDYGMYEPPLYMTDEQIKNSIRDGFFWSRLWTIVTSRSPLTEGRQP